MKKRFWEIDFLRGIAVILMVLFNYSFTLYYFQIYQIAEGWVFWWLFPRLIASIFILLAGISITISYSKNSRWQKHAKRGLKIFSWGLIITAVMWLFFSSATILFGILHLIGLSIILSLFFIRLKLKYVAIFAILFLVIGAYLDQLTFGFNWLLWLGFVPQNFTMLDYFPLLPWFGVFLAGMVLGSTIYRDGKRKFKITKEPTTAKPIIFLGRNSLVIYLLHQLFLVAILFALGLF